MPLDRDLWSCTLGRFEWQPGMLVMNLMDGVSMRLYQADPSGAMPRALTPANGSVEAFSVARTGRIAYAWSTPTQPPDVYILDPGSSPRRLTHFGSVPSDLPIAATRVLEWRDGNGHTLHGQLTVADRGGAAWRATMRR